MSKQELQDEESIIFNELQTNFPEFKKNAKNNFLNLFVKSIASRMYSLRRLANNYIGTLTNINDGDLDYRASFYNITRLQAKKSKGNIFLTGDLNAEIPINSYFINGNYTNKSIGRIALFQSLGQVVINNNIGVVTSNNINELPSGAIIDVTIDSILYQNITIYSSTENGFTFEFENTNSLLGTYIISYTCNCCFLLIEAIIDGAITNLDGNIDFDINQIINGVNNIAYITPQGITGGEDIENDTRLKIRWDLARNGYIANFSEDYIKSYIYENFSQVTRVFIRKATPTVGNVEVYPLFENRINILPSNQERTNIKQLIMQIAPISIGNNNIYVNFAIKIPININYNNVIPNTITMNKAIADTIDLFFKSQNALGKDFAKNDLFIYLLANTKDINNDNLISIDLIATDTTIEENEIAVKGNINA